MILKINPKFLGFTYELQTDSKNKLAFLKKI